MSKVTIAAGDVSDEALQFLRNHGAIIDSVLGISMIELPEDAEVCNPGYQSPPSEYGIQWRDKDGSDPLEWIEVSLELDANDTKVRLKRHIERSQEDSVACYHPDSDVSGICFGCPEGRS